MTDLGQNPGSDASAVWTSGERTSLLRAYADRHAASSREETELLLEAAQIGPGHRVVDLACGSGDPTLEIASRIVPGGHVTGVDLSEGALEVGRERATKAGLTNIAFRAANVESLPFADESFERAVCRFGVMFFENLPRALAEIRRVLRPGGRLALMVWGPADQPYFRSTIGVVLRLLRRPELPPDKSVPYRFAEPGRLEAALADARFTGVESRTKYPTSVWEGTPEDARDVWWSGAVYFRSLLDELDDDARSVAREEIATGFRSRYDGTSVRFPLTVRVVKAVR